MVGFNKNFGYLAPEAEDSVNLNEECLEIFQNNMETEKVIEKLYKLSPK